MAPPPVKSTPTGKSQTSLFSFFRKSPATESATAAATAAVEVESSQSQPVAAPVMPVTPTAKVPSALSTPMKPPSLTAVTPQSDGISSTTTKKKKSIAELQDSDEEAIFDSDHENDTSAKKRKLSNKKTAKQSVTNNKQAKKSTLKGVLDSDEEMDVSEEDSEEDSAFETESDDDDDDDDDDFIADDDEDEDDTWATKKTKKPSANKSSGIKKVAASRAANKKTSSALPPKSGGAYRVTEVSSPSAVAGHSNNSSRSASPAPWFSSAPSSPSLTGTPVKGEAKLMPEGVEALGHHEHDTFDFLQPANRKDANNRPMTHPDFNPRTLKVPVSFLKEQTPAMQQWWTFKSQQMDTILFFKVGKFYELFHMDADVGYAELDLIFMKGSKAHSGFPEIAYGKMASALVTKGFRVARIEQTETPDMLKERNDSLGRGQVKDKVVQRQLCSVLSKGTRTFCHLDDLSLLDGAEQSAIASSLLLCVVERNTQHSHANETVTETETEEEHALSVCEFGLCAVDPALGTVTLAQFADDSQRSRLRAFLSRFPVTEFVIPREPCAQTEDDSENTSHALQFSKETRSLLRLTCPQATIELLGKGELPVNGRATIQALRKGQYFGKEETVASGTSNSEDGWLSSPPQQWPVVLQAVAKGLVHENASDLCCIALGGALWQLQRSLIDYEVLSLGRVFAYVPPDESSETLKPSLVSPDATPNNTLNSRHNSSHLPVSTTPITSTALFRDCDTNCFATASASQSFTAALASAENAEEDHATDSNTAAPVVDVHRGKHLVLDAAALAHLDILCTADGSLKGSLWAFVNRARTPMSRRLLRQWLCQPLFSVFEIRERQRAIQELLSALYSSADSSDSNPTFLSLTASSSFACAAEHLRKAMKGLPDLERLLARVHSNGLKQGNHPANAAILTESAAHSARQIRDFADCLCGLESIGESFSRFASAEIHSKLLRRLCYPVATVHSNDSTNKAKGLGCFPLHELQTQLTHFRSIFDEKAARKDGAMTPRPGVNPDYDEAIAEVEAHNEWFQTYLQTVRQSTGIRDIVYYGNNKDRFQLEIPVHKIDKLPSSWSSKSSKKTHRRYWTDEIEQQFALLQAAEERVKESQRDTLRVLFARFDAHRQVWEQAVQCLVYFDALLALVDVSASANYCWPQLTVRDSTGNPNASAVEREPRIAIVGGRHPTVELLMQERGDGDFIANDVVLGGAMPSATASGHQRQWDFDPRMLLLTGPNMGGKSTLLRMTCLIVLLAQLGCKVPAESCQLTPVDRIFTRVGASDKILAGQSTFFVELAETTLILRNATPDSLCILDELGRGTATFDGTAIAHSVVEWLVSRTSCRSLFATHYHLLVQDWEVDPRVRLGHMDCYVQQSEEDNNNRKAVSAAHEEVTFLYKLCDGASPKSYGINVARLAGLPASLIELALAQSKHFEEKTNQKRFQHENAVSGDADADLVEELTVSSSIVAANSRINRIFSMFERLVSIAHANMSLEELSFVAEEMWKRYAVM